ncbi:uncharacterized protein LOC103695761 [Phoenix dactylifera]|uniref:Uncharacterized protein LOC103695761 n=1 Tax=Phoenix dactylifera TaxID=42345 RepID=A0A8B8IZA4_PHODC|nr:uncharacterized protein LOC103695761 [Phoenix dactylifera]
MVSPRKEGFGNDEKAESSDRPLGGDASEEFREIDGSGSSRPQGTTRTAGGLAERLSDVLRGESDGDLFLGRSDLESGVLQWLRALDLQVLGACRADERLRPLLKLNVSTGAAEDRLITQLSQHFEASEVGLLARCLCAPLVSIRVGKVNKQGNLLCPAATRGHLNLTLLPSSKMRISFIGDDGCVERLAVVSNDLDSSDVLIEDISADSSSRSFLVKLPGSQVLYYWCSEKSEIYGKELLAKMKDLLRGKPTLSHLTGISESRLNSFATHLRAYLIGSSNIAEANSSASSNSLLSTASTLASDSQSSSMVSKSFRFRPTTAHMAKMHPFHQGSLSPRLNTFKDGMPRILSSIKSGAREKLKRRGESHLSSLSTINNQEITSLPTCTTDVVFTRQCEDNISSDNGSCSCVPCSLPDVSCLASPLSSFNPLSIYFPPSQVPTPSSLFTPYYCWCPPCPSSLQYTVTPPHLPSVSTESLPLPPLSSLLPAAGPPVSLVQTKMSIDAVELPSTNFPAPFLDPLVRFPLPVSSLVALPNSQQIPTFTPFMSDPIVHIPVIDVCSSGQGYLVSAAPAIPSAIPPLLPIVNPLMPETESLVEKSARETLRMLMASAPTPATPQLMSVLPVVFSSVNENFSCNHVNKLGAVAASSGSCLCNGTPDIDSIASSMSLIELYPLREGVADEGGNSMTTSHEENSVGEKDGDLPKSLKFNEYGNQSEDGNLS